MNEEKQVFSVIAIDFGTTYCSVGVVQDEKIHIVSDDHGNEKIPSYVAFTDDGYVVGPDALNQVAKNPRNTIYDMKRLLGLNFNDLRRRSDKEFWSFEVITDTKEIKIRVTDKGEIKLFSMEEIFAMILTKLKKMAASYLGTNVANVVITIPDTFNMSQRRAIVEASHLAELKIILIINDSAAAGIANGLNLAPAARNVLVFHLGGGVFNVSILHSENGSFEVTASSGDRHLGGTDFDFRLLKFFTEEIRRLHGKDVSKDRGALHVLRTACERAKCALSDAEEATVDAAELLDGAGFQASLTRERFEQLCGDLFLLIFQHLENVMFVANVHRGEIDRVVLAGGATRMAKIRVMIGSFFDKEITQPVDPERAVVTGAAMEAADLRARGPNLKTTLSIGIESPGTVMTVIIPRESPLPVQKTVNYTTYHDYQQSVTLKVFEGERSLAPCNTALGILNLDGIPLLPRGVPQIDITFDLDTCGLLTVTACERSTGVKNILDVMTSKHSEEEMERILAEAEHFRAEDENERDRLLARDLLETCLMNVKVAMSAPDVVESMDVETHMWYMNLFHTEHQWLMRNPSADKAQYMRRTVDLQIVYLSVVVDMFHDDLEHEVRRRREG